MAKLLLYLTNNQLTATVWDKAGFSAAQSFDPYATGLLKFTKFLQGLEDTPAYLLTDLIEEDFQRETIPHVVGAAKRNLIERRLSFLYRDTAYRATSFQGRETDGRRDDQVLFSALTNSSLLDPWLQALNTTKTNLAGIYSVALLSPLLFEKLSLGKEPALLVTQQSSGLRQSYFHEGKLRFSRLAVETAWSAEAIAETAVLEMAKTRQFLASTRLLARGAAINIVVMAAPEIITHLRALCPDGDGLSYRFLALNEAAQVFGLKQLPEMSVADPLFLSLLLSRRVASHYATMEQTRSHYFSEIRAYINAASIVALLVSLAWATNNGVEAYQAIDLIRQSQFDTKITNARYLATMGSMPMTAANPHDMRTAVDLAEMIDKNAPRPLPSLLLLSRVLEKLPEIKILALNWEVSETDGSEAAMAALAVAAGETPPTTAAGVGISKRPVEVLTLECEIVPFTHDYRFALLRAQQLLQGLQQDPRMQASLTKLPFDDRPSAKLESQVGDDEALAKPQFNLRLVWTP